MTAYTEHNTKPTSFESTYAKGMGKAYGTNIVQKGTNLGKVQSMWATNEGLWFYMPDKSYVYKWYLAKDTTTTPSSSFSGGEEEIWAGFDNSFDITFK